METHDEGQSESIDYGDQDENGVDLSLLRENLRRTPTERLIRLEQAAASLDALKRNAVKRVRQSSGTA
jgi:hypothetical protein